MFDVLADTERRRILLELAALESRREASLGPEDFHAGDQGIDRFRAKLYHTHLPKLAEAGYVEWDWDAGTIRQGPAFEEVKPFLDLLDAHGLERSAGPCG